MSLVLMDWVKTIKTVALTEFIAFRRMEYVYSARKGNKMLIFPHIPSWCSKIKERNFTHRGEKGEKEKGLAYKSKET